ncbi:MAG TPA: CBS domain-containing protein [Pyrinomonadaceae bacterium]
MATPNPDSTLPSEQQGRSYLEFMLVVIMLGVLTILIILVLWTPLIENNPCMPASAANANQTAAANNTNQPQPAANANTAEGNANVNANVNTNGNTNRSGNVNANVNASGSGNVGDAGTTALIEQLRNDRDIRQRADCLEYSRGILDRRKDILAIILTAFGAWVGAGAAYFFGRENLRVAANSLLRMQSQSTTERLRTTTIAEVPPKPLDWLIKKSQTVGEVYDKLRAESERWFVPVVHEDTGALLTVIEEEALYRYMIDESGATGVEEGEEGGEGEGELESPPSPPAAPRDRTVEELINHINTSEEFVRYRRVFVRVKMETSVETANEQMDRQGIYLAIVVSDKDKPTHFITTAEVRKLLLKTD